MSDTPQGTATELLQMLIRNECVYDGAPESGTEVRNADLLRDDLEGATTQLERFAPIDDRTSLVARIEGSDPAAPTLCLMGHTDVVPVNPDGWSHEPFGGEFIRNANGVDEVWGCGAIDMLNMTATMAVAFRDLAASGWRPRGTLVYFAVADEEAGGAHREKWMTEHHWDAVGADYVLKEMGGFPIGSTELRRAVVNVAEKGTEWRRLRVTGTPGHGSMPFGSDNALVTAAEVIRRLSTHRPAAAIGDAFRADRHRLARTLRRLLDPHRPHALRLTRSLVAACIRRRRDSLFRRAATG
jgi:acetylornithine deacetylase/succinyl-diaminopimelate desuccinylase-like protein